MNDTVHQLVGRDRELDVLERLLGEVRAGSSRFVIVSGEPGIGKSSLVAQLARRAEAAGYLVLEGRATELERDFPFGLLVDALDGYLASLDARSFDRLAAEELGELASVFPALRALRRSGGALGTAAERFRAHFAARELRERLAAPRPLLLTLDDLQWSDDASMEFIGHLLRRPPDAAVMLAATIRTGPVAQILAAAIDGASRRRTLHQLELGPLDRDQAATLVGEMSTEELDLLYRESGGNPFYLLQLARAPSLAPTSPEAEWTDRRGVPPAVRSAIAAELDRLPAQVRAFAQAAAVVGDPFELDLAVATAALTPTDALGALDDLVARDLLRAADVPRRFRFRHPLVRHAIYVSCPPGTRLVCHERAAAALAAQAAPAVSQAHHVVHSARHGDAAAARLLREAGFEVSQRAPMSAVVWLEAAVRILPSSTPAAERLELIERLAGVYAATGRLEDSRTVLLSAASLAEDVSTRVRLTSACAKTELLLGRREQAQTRLLEALDEVSESNPDIEARLMVELASSAFHGADIDGIRDWASRALDIARNHQDRGLTVGALSRLVLAEASGGPVSAAQTHCSEAVTLVDGMPDEELVGELDALADLCGAEYQLQRFLQVEAHARRGLALARASGRGDLFPWLSLVLSGVLLSTGRLVAANEMLDGLVEAARLSDNTVGLASALVNSAAVSLAAGDLDDAMEAAQEAVALTRGMTPSVVGAWAGGFLGAALLEAGQPERAASTMIAAGGGDHLSLIPGGFRVNFLEMLTRAWLASGHQAEAKQTAEIAQQRAQQFGLGLSNAGAELATAAVALETGDVSLAVASALAAAEHADGVGARLAAGLSRSLAGRALASLGQPERAASQLTRAVAELEGCGARRHVAAAERELRRLGRPVHHRTPAGTPEGGNVASLTGRELEIARLVVGRRTNPEIAAELFLSIKTVETHLRNIFRKLDVTSRVEVARIIERDTATAGRTP